MLPYSDSLYIEGSVSMAQYKFVCQYGVEVQWLDLGFYYCTMNWYAYADTTAEYDHAREGAIRITSELLARNTVIWDLFVECPPGGTVVEHTHPSWPHPVLSGELLPAECTVFISLRSGGRQVSFKRVRGPVRKEDMDDDGNLTNFAFDYYQSVADLVSAYGCFTTYSGIPIADAVVQREVANWQLRHGTERRNRRRMV
jgi:hypothetical protein